VIFPSGGGPLASDGAALISGQGQPTRMAATGRERAVLGVGLEEIHQDGIERGLSLAGFGFRPADQIGGESAEREQRTSAFVYDISDCGL